MHKIQLFYKPGKHFLIQLMRLLKFLTIVTLYVPAVTSAISRVDANDLGSVFSLS